MLASDNNCPLNRTKSDVLPGKVLWTAPLFSKTCHYPVLGYLRAAICESAPDASPLDYNRSPPGAGFIFLRELRDIKQRFTGGGCGLWPVFQIPNLKSTSRTFLVWTKPLKPFSIVSDFWRIINNPIYKCVDSTTESGLSNGTKNKQYQRW